MANVNERFTNYDEFEFAQQRRDAAKLKKELQAKRDANQGLQKPVASKKFKKTTLQKQMDANGKKPEEVDSINSIIKDLRTRFLINGREIPGDESIKKMQQFMRFTSRDLAKKNIAGGSIFTDSNQTKKEDEFGNIFNNVYKIRKPAMEIASILKSTGKFDTQHLESLKNKILDLCDALSTAPYEIIHDPAALDAIQRKVPFWVGGSSEGGGHNVGFRDILRQFNKDMKNQTYQQIANRIEDFISNGKDPLSYVAESKKTTIKESQLKQLIKESIINALNEGTTDNEILDKWNQVEETIGAQQMLDCIFQWVDEDTINQWLQWFENEEWVSFDNNEDEEY